MPLGRLNSRFNGRAATYQPFPLPPDQVWNAAPIKEGPYGYSSSGLTVMGYKPKRPSEILAEITAQYEERVVNRWGQEIRGGPGKRKGKNFFRAHLTWYGVQYEISDSLDELEERLLDALNTRPPPPLAPSIYAIEAEMRQRYIEETVDEDEQYRVVDRLASLGHTSHTSQLLAELTGTSPASMTDQFFDDRVNFFWTQFPPGVSRQHVVVLGSFDTIAEHEVWDECVDRRGLCVEKVENNSGRGRNRGRFVEFVVGVDRASVRAKANELRGANTRYNPY